MFSSACARWALVRSATVFATALATTATMTFSLIGPMAQSFAHQTVNEKYQSVNVPLLALTALGTNIPAAQQVAPVTASPTGAVTAPTNQTDWIVLIGLAALIPVWYVGSFITLPISLLLGYAVANYPFGFGTVRPTLLEATFEVYTGPLTIFAKTISRILNPAAPAAAALRSPRAARVPVSTRSTGSPAASLKPAGTASKRAAKVAAASRQATTKSTAASAASKRRPAG